MGGMVRLLAAVGLAALCCLGCRISSCEGQPDYRAALANSLLYFEGQRSGRLPPDQRVRWRGDSALADGSDHGVDLTGGYYDSGDNVKFGLPMAFTVTMLSWSVVQYERPLATAGELRHALAAVRWGADYLARAHAGDETLYVQVGDGYSDHSCWQRPEDMDTPRTVYSVNASSPGSDVAAETAAALAAAAVAFRRLDSRYSATLLAHAEQLFRFAKNHRGLYHKSVPAVASFYPSGGDELLWAAVWLYVATGGEDYKAYIAGAGNSGQVQSEFSWDNKFVGAQALILVLEGKLADAGNPAVLKSNLEQFLCNVLQRGGSAKQSPGGVLWWQRWNNLQFVTSAAFILAAHSDHLAAAGASLQCGGVSLPPSQLLTFARSQVDYILGANPGRMSYMVGYGTRFPAQVHHRGASVPSIEFSPGKITCKGGLDYLNKDAPNPNVIMGAIVGGPDENDQYNDDRKNYQQGEPSTVTVAPIVGVLARLLQE
ncbi:endoglucanase 14-like [Phragmites australis]|uniref:endoglucanase 14-like n=1 Tax=Phragmites australis TaxID=29695 RepID=UPI002D77EB59|nr:endoglucanase 14-like [Phragmites australis]